MTPLLTYIIAKTSWENVFYLTGLLGIIFGVIWLLVYRDPHQSKRTNQAELDIIHENENATAKEIDKSAEIKKSSHTREIFYILKQRKIWGVFITQFACSSTLYFFLTWFITYLEKGLNLPIATAVFLLAFHI